MEIFLIVLLIGVGSGVAFLGWKTHSEFKEKANKEIAKLKLESQKKDGLVDENEACKANIVKLKEDKSRLEKSLRSEMQQLQKENKRIEAKVADQSRDYARELSTLAKDYETKLVDQLREYDDRLSVREKRYESRATEQKQGYETKLSNQEKNYEEKLSRQEKNYETKIADCETKLSKREKDYDEKLLKQKQGYETKISDQKQGYETELETRRTTYKEETDSLTKGYEEKITAMNRAFNEKYSNILGFCTRSFTELAELAFRYRPPLDRNKEKFMSGFRHLTDINEFDADSLESEFKGLSEYIYLMGNERLIALSKTSDMGLQDFVNVFTDRIAETNVENLGEDDKKRYIVFFNTLEDFLKPIEKRVTHFDRLPHENQRLLVLSDLRRLYRDQILQVNKDFEEELITDEEKDNAIDMIEEFRDLEIGKIRSTIEMA